ncbi:MAG: molybdopterin-dependent oxidoreductase [Acidimicrobiia bacterium]
MMTGVTREQRSFCRICLANCGVVVTVDGDQVIAIRGDPDDPLSRGYVCPKGRGLAELHHQHRLDGAFVRRNGVLQPVSVEEGLDAAAAGIREVLDRHGPSAVASFSGSGGFSDPMGAWAAQTLKAALGVTQSYSTSTVDAVSKTFVALQMAGASALIPHPDREPRLLLHVGSNPVVSHGQSTPIPNPVEHIRAARRSGEVWVVDPRHTETAALADRHLAARPGTDHALLAFVLRALLTEGAAEGGVDRALVSERAVGVDELAELVAPFDRDRVSALTGVDAASLDDLVEAVQRAGRLAIVTGTGTTMARRAYLTEWMAWALMIVTDSFDQPGGMWFNPGYYYRLDRRPRPLRPVVVDGPGPPSRPEILPFLGEWPAALIPEEIESGRLHALVVIGANPATALPDAERLHRAFGQLDVLLALDVAPTETTALATHVFGCADQLERPDIPSLDLFGGALATQWTDAVVPPNPNSPEMWRIFAKLADRLGHSILEPGEDPDRLATETLLVRTHPGLDVEALRRAGGYLYDAPAVYGWVQAKLPYGKWNLAPELLAAQLVGAPDPPALQLAPRRQARRMNGIEFRAGDLPEAVVHPVDAAPERIADGDLVDVTTATGCLRLRAKVTDTVAIGTVSVPHGWGEANVNVLVDSNDIDPITGMPVLSGTAVRLRRATD